MSNILYLRNYYLHVPEMFYIDLIILRFFYVSNNGTLLSKIMP